MVSIQPWYWRKLPLKNRTGSQVFAALFLYPREPTLGSPIATLLESPHAPHSHASARYSICAGGPRSVPTLEGKSQQVWTPAISEILSFLRRLLPGHSSAEQGLPPFIPSDLPFAGGWLGWLGYDLAWEIECLPHLNPDPLPFPVAYWYEPDQFAVLDHHQQILWLATTEVADLDQLQAALDQAAPNQWPLQPDPNPVLAIPKFHLSQGEYEAMVRQAQTHIQAGDIFQANLSLRFEAQTTKGSWSIYQTLQRINPSPFASYWQTPWGAVISCSPERLIQHRDRQVQTRPIAGTRSRGATLLEDQALAEVLLANRKEQAEHIMLVDLERNDLGRVCDWGSVQVDELLTIERYSHVMHLVSNITGQLHRNCDVVDLIRSVFPGGTITGCPKVRCMEIIEKLEPVKRNLFYGSCGYLDWRGHLDLNILIRTLLYQSSCTPSSAMVWGQVGAGIVADSDPTQEWQESLHKAQAQLLALRV